MAESLPKDRIDAIPVREHMVSETMKKLPEYDVKMEVNQIRRDLFIRSYGLPWVERNCVLVADEPAGGNG